MRCFALIVGTIVLVKRRLEEENVCYLANWFFVIGGLEEMGLLTDCSKAVPGVALVASREYEVRW